MEWLLSPEQIEAAILTDLFEDDLDKRVCKAQLALTVEMMEEPCGDYRHYYDGRPADIYESPDGRIHYRHRKDCPQCIEQMKQEAEG